MAWHLGHSSNKAPPSFWDVQLFFEFVLDSFVVEAFHMPRPYF